ncbi:Putative membrane protein (modular protein) [uncultured Mycobacterium sp.]|uniref:Putative membrane protein (Modular protein) n=1 Tax=uncultured Mycobacterium sp. TaxID=171292 RepID=A0A1Y5PC89_9MYCO|nr:Putative membrane protein (modular protein) [uncultured Mycobacterium sp.]
MEFGPTGMDRLEAPLTDFDRKANTMKIGTWTVPAFLEDLGERAGKTFCQSTLAALPITFATEPFQVSPFLSAAAVGLSGAVYSVMSSLASFKRGVSGTASLTKAVAPSSDA